MTPGDLNGMTNSDFNDCLREGIAATMGPLVAFVGAVTGDPTGQAARACGRDSGNAVPMSVRKGIALPRPGTPLTVREALCALECGAAIYAHVAFMQDGIGREVQLSPIALRERLLKIDGDESTQFVLEAGNLILV